MSCTPGRSAVAMADGWTATCTAVKYDRGSPEEGARMGFAGNGAAVIGTGFIVPTGAAR
jgi:hypothetical protein